MIVKPDWNSAVRWHKELCENKGQRATLKRCKTIEEIYLQPAYVDFIRKIGAARSSDTLPIIAGILAYVDQHLDGGYPKLAAQMAKIKSGRDSPVISPIRFRHLLSCNNKNLLFRYLVRIVKQVEFFDIADFAEDIYWWNSKSKKRWACSYYESLPDTHNKRK